MTKCFIGVLRFDGIATFEEFQQIIILLLGLGFNLEIHKLPNKNILPGYAAWQLEITKHKEA